MSKKRKLIDEGRVFQDKWTIDYFFVLWKENPVCLVCTEIIAVLKEYNLKRHYMTKHPSYQNLSGPAREEKIEKLRKALIGQKTFFVKKQNENNNIVQASYVVAEKIAKNSKTYSDGEFVKECLLAVSEIVCPEKKKDFENISLSRRTVTRRVEDLGSDIESSLMKLCMKFETFSLAIDESTDVTDIAQLAVFVRGVDSDFNVTEEMLGLQSMKGTTTGEDIFLEVKKLMKKFNLSTEKLHSLSTDGAPSMVGSKNGFVSKMKAETSVHKEPKSFIGFHCMIHQQNLCAKSVKFSNIMSTVVSCVNFIKSRALNHRQFQEFLDDMDAEYGTLAYYCEVRWLSKGKMLKQFYELREEVFVFMEMKGKSVSELQNEDWVRELAFLVDLTSYLNELNLKLQGRGQLVHDMYKHIKVFQTKLQLWERQLKHGNVFHFPTLAQHEEADFSSFANELQSLNKEFSDRFKDFNHQDSYFTMISSPFEVDVEFTPENLQMELLELKGDNALHQRFKETSLVEFYKSLPREDYPQILKQARNYISIFGSTYQCEQLFSRMKHAKSKTKSRLTNEHLELSLRVATSQILPDIESIVKKMNVQKSH